MRVIEAGGDLIRDGWGRFRRAWIWVAAEYVGLAGLISLGLLRNRIPKNQGWEVALTIALPAIAAAGFLWLQAGLARGFLSPSAHVEATEEEEGAEPKRVAMAWGAATLLLWLALGWLAGMGLDWLDMRNSQWTADLISRLGPHARATWGSYDQLFRDIQWALWTLRWVMVPGLLVPVGICSAAWGVLRMPGRRVMRVWSSWKWWPVVAAWALIGEAWPQTWFETPPKGMIGALPVLLRVAGAYLLGVTAWVKVLGWGAMLVNPRPRTRMDEPILTLGLEIPAVPAATPRESAKETKVRDGIVGRPLPKGNEHGSGNA